MAILSRVRKPVSAYPCKYSKYSRRSLMSTSYPATPMGSEASLASTADINNPFSLDYVERVGPPPEFPSS
eukprot:4985543-Amphidinium_carterae.1